MRPKVNLSEIEAEVTEMLVEFSDSLKDVKLESDGKKVPSRSNGFREEGNGKGADKDFRKRIFRNAPKKNKHHIIAEKGNW